VSVSARTVISVPETDSDADVCALASGKMNRRKSGKIKKRIAGTVLGFA